MNNFKTTLDRLPIMGVGFGFNFDLPLTTQDVSRLRQGDLKGFHYIEVQTPHVLLFHDMWQIIETAPTIIHCSQFSLGSPQPKKDGRFVDLTRAVMRRARTPWFAEHISLSHFPGGDTRHFFLPYLDRSIAENVVRNGAELQGWMGYPMLLENAPRLFDVTSQPIDEGAFIADVINECQCGYLLDLSSARKTCLSLNYSFDDYVARMPLDVLTEMHVGDIVLERALAIDLIRSCPVKAVTLEANLSKAGDEELRSFIECINDELQKKNKRSRVSLSTDAAVGREINDFLPSEIDMSRKVRFSEGTSITLDKDHIAIHSRGSDTTLLPHEATKVISGMLLGDSLSRMLDLSDPNIAMSVVTLSSHAELSGNGECSGWADWGLAEAFHRSVRSSASTRFEGKEAFEARLSTPESQARRPRFAKEYAMHPYFRLPSPTKFADDSVTAALLKRRTCRDFNFGSIPLERISNVLYYSCGWTASGTQLVGGMPIIRKTSPSAGSMASVESYLIALAVDGLVPGIYHYSLINHGLELLNGENPSEWFAEGCGDQSWVSGCSAAILLCGVPARLAWKYPMPKAYQAMLMEVGHVSQTALLCSTAEGLECFCTAALREGMFEERIQLEPLEETPLLLIGIGHGKNH
jgi:SagB-type dehydrogenase family enzyme